MVNLPAIDGDNHIILVSLEREGKIKNVPLSEAKLNGNPSSIIIPEGEEGLQFPTFTTLKTPFNSLVIWEKDQKLRSMLKELGRYNLAVAPALQYLNEDFIEDELPLPGEPGTYTILKQGKFSIEDSSIPVGWVFTEQGNIEVRQCHDQQRLGHKVTKC